MGTQAFANGSSQISSGSVTDGQGEPYARSTGTYYPAGREDKNGNYPVYIDNFKYPGGSNVNRVVIAGVTNAGYYYSSTSGTTNVTIYGNAGTLGFGTGTAGTTYTGSNRFTGANYSRGLCGSYDFRYVNTAPTTISPSRNIRSVTVATSGAGGSDANAPSSYTVQYRDNVDTSWRGDQSFNTATASNTTFSNFISGRTYYFRSWANNDIGSSVIYTAGSVYIPNVPSAPTGVTATTSTTQANAINISWSKPASDVTITQYKIYNAATNALIATVNGENTLSYAHINLSPRGVQYSYYVRAVNEIGDSANSSPTGLVTASSVPGGPSSIISPFENSTLKIGRNVTIQYTEDANFYSNSSLGYFMQFSTDDGATWHGWDNATKTKINNGENLVTGGSFTYQLLTPALTYKWRVYAKNIIGTGDLTRVTPVGVFVSAGGRRWSGSSWNPTTTSKRFDGTNWVDFTIAKRFNGTSWVDLT